MKLLLKTFKSVPSKQKRNTWLINKSLRNIRMATPPVLICHQGKCLEPLWTPMEVGSLMFEK